jgi:hypothetical protein
MSGFPSIELGLPGKPACPDEYTGQSTLFCGGAGKLRVQTSLAYVMLQFGDGIAAPVWGPEEPFSPIVGSITRGFDAVRVRNLVAGKAAQVILTADPT